MSSSRLISCLLITVVFIALFDTSDCGFIKQGEEFVQIHTTTPKQSKHIIDAKLNCADNEKPITPNLCKRIY